MYASWNVSVINTRSYAQPSFRTGAVLKLSVFLLLGVQTRMYNYDNLEITATFVMSSKHISWRSRRRRWVGVGGGGWVGVEWVVALNCWRRIWSLATAAHAIARDIPNLSNIMQMSDSLRYERWNWTEMSLHFTTTATIAHTFESDNEIHRKAPPSTQH